MRHDCKKIQQFNNQTYKPITKSNENYSYNQLSNTISLPVL